MDFRLLAPLEVAERDCLLDLGGVKRRSLLPDLLLHPNAVVASDRLIAELWDERPPATAAESLHISVSRLRQELGERRLLTRAAGYVLHGARASLTSAASTASSRRRGGRSRALPPEELGLKPAATAP